MPFFPRGALPRTPLGAPPPDPRVSSQKVRVRLSAEITSKRLGSKKIAMYCTHALLFLYELNYAVL